ncbi:hypothetical protein [Halopiger xanaduensis]|uniref:Uncharacterized protein n=1 Tax=Halopiger xanaduensis (strain DSM 18323 / JCM 14033 / SH-6) TaxID=797210 RepID=F8DEU0_HALXS|nr:hypothetical protein [Halopiger xanaduensis]AEH39530.1 hypothetical protein Halxa_0291 [Halopiger xanaduensis SH-6]
MRPAKRAAEAQQRRKRIDRLYEHFDDCVALITDAELQDEVLDWMDAADKAPAASILTHVETRLAEFETEHEMYAVDVNGEDHFPDDCSDCEHYGVACPILTNRYEQIERKKLRERLRGASEDEIKRELRRYAGNHGCVVMIELIEDWEQQYESILEDGRKLRRKTLEILRPADERDRADAEIGETVADATEGRP